MVGSYELIKYMWQNLFVENFHDNPLAFDGASNKEILLPRLLELPDLPHSILEVGPMYNTWARTIVKTRPITRVHLSDTMYKTRGIPTPEKMGIDPDIFTADESGLPELLDLLPKLGLGETTIILANILNYVDGDDIARLLNPIGEAYQPQVVVIGNNFDATLGSPHTNRVDSLQTMEAILDAKGYGPIYTAYNTNVLAGIYQRS